MVGCVRLVAVVLAVVCITATMQTGSWRGPADLASVGEGHSRLPDRPFDALLEQLVDQDEVRGCVDFDVRWMCATLVYSALGSSRAHGWRVVESLGAGSPRGPPIA
jgi:hypothetical protein